MARPMPRRSPNSAPLERLSKAELLREVRTLLEARVRDRDLRRLVHDVQVSEEQIRVQAQQLIEAQHELELSRDRYADLFERAPVGYVTLNPAGVVEEINLTAADVLGIERGRVLGMPLVHYVATGDRRVFLEHMRRCRAGGDAITSELHVHCQGGPPIPVQLYSTRSSAPPPFRAYRTAIIDQRERLHAENEQRRLLREETAARAANEAKDRFLAMLSHELRTPLAPVLLAVTDLERRPEVPQSIRGKLGMIRRNLELERTLIDDLLDVSRIVRGRLELRPTPLDLHAAVRDALEMCAPELETRAVHVELAARDHGVLADPARIRQAFTNVLRNAARATPAGGSITIRSENRTRGRVVVAVTDDGVGIHPADVPRIFTPFTQGMTGSRTLGLGLGLAICKAIVDALGGRITAASEGLGKGAQVEIELPLSRAPVDAADTPAEARPTSTVQGLTVLLVEDHADTREALSAALGLEGFRVKEADSVAHALEQADDDCDVVVSDLALPDGSGLDLIRALHTKRPVPGIALSGFGREEDQHQSYSAGFDVHLTKPVTVDVLMGTIQQLCQRRRR
jgi:PAS domain S-box-containing protein